jgi:ADP-dependent NAD(P)H-hydrate dehydratase / NAD(P)H-hydrate epimerase
MPLPAPLSRDNPRSSKKDFGHLLIIAGSPAMLGAAALSSLAAMRSGAGLVTAAVPRNLNLTLQKKISNVVMTMPLAQSRSGAFSLKAYDQIKKIWDRFDAIAIGPGIGRDLTTQQLAREIIIHCPKPLVIDADALFALSGHTQILLKDKAARVLTPHCGEMSRLTKRSVKAIEADRLNTTCDFARRYNCVVLLKGRQTVVASPQGKAYINHTGNAGMATAGSGDVLTGMITAFLGQGMGPFDAAKYGAYYHGKAGDLAAGKRSKVSMIASDIIEQIPFVLKN